MSFGAMITILLTWLFQSYGISLGLLPTALLAMPLAIIATILFSITTDRFIFRHYLRNTWYFYNDSTRFRMKHNTND